MTTTDGIRHTTPTPTTFAHVFAGDIVFLDGSAWVVDATGFAATTDATHPDGRRIDPGTVAIVARRADGHRVRFTGRPGEDVMFAHHA